MTRFEKAGAGMTGGVSPATHAVARRAAAAKKRDKVLKRKEQGLTRANTMTYGSDAADEETFDTYDFIRELQAEKARMRRFRERQAAVAMDLLQDDSINGLAFKVAAHLVRIFVIVHHPQGRRTDHAERHVRDVLLTAAEKRRATSVDRGFVKGRHALMRAFDIVKLERDRVDSDAMS